MKSDCCEWVDPSSDSFLLTFTAADIYMFLDLRIYIINGFEYVFSWDDGYVNVCSGILSMSRSTIWHHNFDKDVILRIQ